MKMLRIAALLAMLLALLAPLAAAAAPAKAAPGGARAAPAAKPPAATTAAAPADLIKVADEVAKDVEALRGWKFKEPVKKQLVTEE